MKNFIQKNLLLLFIKFTFIVQIFAQGGSIKGFIYDSETNQPLVGATISIQNTSIGASSNLFGFFQLDKIPSGNQTLQIRYIGFENLTQAIEVKAEETTTNNFNLKPGSLQLADIIVNSGDELKINAINSVDVELRPVNSSQDILRVVPGLFIAQHAGGGKAEQIFLRGFDIDHGTDINLTVDGLPVNMVSHAHGQGYSDLHFVIPELVDVVAFDKGPYYTRKGNFTTAGFVEFNTKNALNKSMIKIEGGQFDTYRTLAMIDLLGKKAKENKQSAYIATEYLATQNYFDSPQNFNRLNIFAKYHQYFEDNKILSLSLSTFRSQWDASGQIPERTVASGQIGRFGAIDDTEGGFTDRSNINLKFTNILPDGSFINNQVYFSNYNFELYSNFTFFLNDSLNGDQIRQKENRNIFGYNASYSKEFRFGRMSLISEIGAGLRYDNIRNNELSRTIARRIDNEFLSRGDVDESNAAVYLDETLQISPQLSLNVGLRFDYFKFEYLDALNPVYDRDFQNKTILSPKFNINYDVNKNIRLYAKSGMGFHSNDTRVVTAQLGNRILPKAYGIDFGTIIKPFKNMILQAAAWRLDLEQEFVYVGDEGVVEAGGKTKRQGLDFSLRYQLTDWLFADVDVNLTEGESVDDPEGENFIPLAPDFTSIGGLSFHFKNGLNGSFRYRYMGDRPANEDNSVNAEGYFLADVVLNYTRPKYQVGISIINALNREWKEAQFDTESRLKDEIEPVSEIHFTPGSPFFLKASLSYFF